MLHPCVTGKVQRQLELPTCRCKLFIRELTNDTCDTSSYAIYSVEFASGYRLYSGSYMFVCMVYTIVELVV